MRKRLTRREIVQQDQIGSALTGILAWIARYRWVITGTAAALLLIIAGSVVWEQRQSARAAELQVKFGQILDLYWQIPPEAEFQESTEAEAASEEEAAEAGDSVEKERLQDVLNQFAQLEQEASSADLGLLSRYFMALISERLGEPQSAQEHLDVLLRNSPGPEIESLALATQARLAGENEDAQRARELFELVLSADARYFPKDSVLLELAESHEASGNATDALRLYRRLTEEYPESTYLQRAQNRIAQLEGLQAPTPQ